jgi:hypothetical protein
MVFDPRRLDMLQALWAGAALHRAQALPGLLTRRAPPSEYRQHSQSFSLQFSQRASPNNWYPRSVSMMRHAWLYAVAAALAAADGPGTNAGDDYHFSWQTGTYFSLVRGPCQRVQGIRGLSAVACLM